MDDLPVSVIIPTHNRASVVPRAVASALACLRPGDEVIVVDDGSSDGTAEALAPYADRIRYEPVPHGGAGRARNRGVALARGPLVAFLDSDDEWAPDKIELQRRLLARRPEVVFCFTDFAARHEGWPDDERYLARWHGDSRGWDAILGPAEPYSAIADLPPGRPDFAVHAGDLYPEVLSGHFVPTFTLVVHRERAGEALRFAEDVDTYEDLECHARLARVGAAAYLDTGTAFQWGHAGPRLTDANVLTCAVARRTIVERVYGHDPDFLAHHHDAYEREVRSQALLAARWLLRRGRAAEARAQLRGLASPPLAYRMAVRVPDRVLAGGLRAVGRVAGARSRT